MSMLDLLYGNKEGGVIKIKFYFNVFGKEVLLGIWHIPIE